MQLYKIQDYISKSIAKYFYLFIVTAIYLFFFYLVCILFLNDKFII